MWLAGAQVARHGDLHSWSTSCLDPADLLRASLIKELSGIQLLSWASETKGTTYQQILQTVLHVCSFLDKF